MHIFENIHKKRLKNTFNRFVKDSRFWEELEKMFDAGYFMELSSQKVVGSKLLHPFLLNVYMHDFDQFVENLSDEYRNIAILCNKNNYKDLNIQKCRSRRSGKFSIQMSKVYDELAKHSTKYDKFLSNCVVSKCLQYVRYSEDLLIGMVSSRKFAIFTKKELENFLKSNLHLTLGRYGIIHRDQSSISFLGHTIQLVYFYPKVRAKSKLLEAIYRYKNKVLQRLRLEKYKISRLQANKFKKKVLKHLGVILSELGLKGKKKN